MHIIGDDFIPDLIISDNRLKESITGTETINAIKEELKRNIPAILITGDTSPERLIEAAQSGYELLHKPVRPGLLRKTIAFLMTAPNNTF